MEYAKAHDVSVGELEQTKAVDNVYRMEK